MRYFPEARSRRGATLIETLCMTFVLLLIITAVLGLTAAATRTADQRTLEMRMNSYARTTLDEMLRELRAADQIMVSRAIAGRSYVTDHANLVFEAPGFDPASPQGILPGVYDVVAFRYDAAKRELVETTLVGAGSKRAARTELVVAKNVQSAVYTFRVRDQFTSAGTASFTLNARASTAPRAYVNGVSAACTYDAALRIATLSVAPASGADVQFLYTVSPTADGGTWLAYVNGVDVTLTLTGADGRAITRTIILAGNARMRNQRT